MRRREFIAGFGAAVASPLVARAQQGERVRRVGVLMPFGENEPVAKPRVSAFTQALADLGWTDGQNVKIDYRWPAGDADKARQHAAELVALGPDVIFALSSASLTQLLQATRTVPIVFVGVSDPVGAGYVHSLSRPGGNATGFALFEFFIFRSSVVFNGNRIECMFPFFNIFKTHISHQSNTLGKFPSP